MRTRCALPAALACLVAVGCSESIPTAPSPTSLDAALFPAASPARPEDQHHAVQGPKGAITIVQGSIIVENGSIPRGSAFLRGTGGFTLEASLLDGVSPTFFCGRTLGIDCVPGTSVPLQGTWHGMSVSGTATLRGQTFTNLGGLSSHSGAAIELSGTWIAPPQADEATVTTPFTLKGGFSWPGGTELLEGRGIATLFLRWVELDGGWVVTGAHFDIKAGRG